MLRLPLALVLFAALASAQLAPAQARRSFEAGRASLPALEQGWLDRLAGQAQQRDSSWDELFGYDPPGRAVSLARVGAWLYAESGEASDARAVAELLARMGRYRERLPAAWSSARPEYAHGLPAAPNFFHLVEFAEAWAAVRANAAIEGELREEVDAALASSAEHVLHFPEWGAHNRAMLRAAGLLASARALPEHPQAADWERLAHVLASDSLHAWEIEDAALYQPIWLLALLRYARLAEREAEVLESIPVRATLRAFLELLTPAGNLPAYGDAWWNSSLDRTFACLAWGAHHLGDPELAWGAARVRAALGGFEDEAPPLGRAHLAALLHDRLPAATLAREPRLVSGPVVGGQPFGKLVWRDGWDAQADYLCASFRGALNWGGAQQEYLRRTLAVEHEKAHHGNEDEGSIALWMHAGSVLLHDGGYREAAPSGPHGSFRADVFHNRLVARRDAAPADSLLARLLDAGTYQPARAELWDHQDLGPLAYARLRMEHPQQGYASERILLRLPALRTLIVLDRFVPAIAGRWTLASLWHTQHVRDHGPGWAIGAYESLRGDALPQTRELWVGFPGSEQAPRIEPIRRHAQDEWVLAQPVELELQAGAAHTLVSALRSIPTQGDVEARSLALRLLNVDPASAGVALEIEDGPVRHLLWVRTDPEHGLGPAQVRPRDAWPATRVVAGPLATDASLAYARVEDGRAHWWAAELTALDYAEQELFRARSFQVFQPSGRSDRAGQARWRRWNGVAELAD